MHLEKKRFDPGQPARNAQADLNRNFLLSLLAYFMHV